MNVSNLSNCCLVSMCNKVTVWWTIGGLHSHPVLRKCYCCVLQGKVLSCVVMSNERGVLIESSHVVCVYLHTDLNVYKSQLNFELTLFGYLCLDYKKIQNNIPQKKQFKVKSSKAQKLT